MQLTNGDGSIFDDQYPNTREHLGCQLQWRAGAVGRDEDYSIGDESSPTGRILWEVDVYQVSPDIIPVDAVDKHLRIGAYSKFFARTWFLRCFGGEGWALERTYVVIDGERTEGAQDGMRVSKTRTLGRVRSFPHLLPSFSR